MRAVPGSTTYLMPGTVSEVSATLVASTTRRPVCAAKTRCCSAADSRAYSGRISVPSAALRDQLAQRVGGVPDLPLAGLRKTRMSPGPSAASSSTASQIAWIWSRTSPRRRRRPRRPRRARPAAGSAPPPGRCGRRPRRPAPAVRAGEVPGEPLRVDGRRGDDHLEVGAAGQQLLEVAEDEVDVEAALVRLVDDQRVVAAQHPVGLDLGQQDAVGHQLDQRVAR